MRFSFAVLLYLILEFGFTFTAEDFEDSETLSPFSIVDYRFPFKHQQLLSVQDAETGLKYYFDRLHIDYPWNNLDSIRQTPRHLKWSDEYIVYKLYVRNMYACELRKTRLSQMKFKYYDEMTENGLSACYNQCMAENDYYFQYLSSKLQDLTYKNPLLDIALNAPRIYSGHENMSQCIRLAKKKYRCECYYKNYQIKVSPEFERLFGKILMEARDIAEGETDQEEIETKYGVPLKLMGFLIIYHLFPEQMFLYLLWWTNTEKPAESESADVSKLE